MKTHLFLVVLCIALITACNEDDNFIGGGPGSNPNSETVEIVDQTLTNVVGQSTLIRQKNGVTTHFRTNDLIPGHAYTLWWVVWNKPQNCINYPDACDEPDFNIADEVEVEVLYAAGQVAGASGSGTFSARLDENDTDGSINHLFGLPSYGGMHDAQTAEVHLVLRSHGPKIPGQVNEQITTYGGGCTTEIPAFTTVPMQPGECSDIQASVHQADN